MCLQNFGRENGRKRTFERPRRRWEDYIKRDFNEVGGGGGMDWIGLA
jgi:hypothetical protein